MNLFKNGILLLIIAIVFFSCKSNKNVTKKQTRVLFINSYHKGYEWSDGIFKGVVSSLNLNNYRQNEYHSEDGKIMLKHAYLNSKKIKAESILKTKALQIKLFIDKWQPDIVISADDNVAKYIVKPYLNNTKIPVVFCGINWDEKSYGFSKKNITGVIEAPQMKSLITLLQKYSKGKKFGVIIPNTYTSNKIIKHFKNNEKIVPHAVAKVNSFIEFKTEFVKMQDKVDFMVIGNNAGITGWDDKQAKEFILKRQKIPTGSTANWMQPYVLLGISNIPFEQGFIAANMAKKIINGRDITDIQIVIGQKRKFFYNYKLAKKLNISF